MSGAVREFMQQDNLGRLLILLHAVFGDETHLDRGVFLSWRANESLSGALDEVLAGERATEPAELQELATLIAPCLVQTPEPDKAALAQRIALTAVVATPKLVGDAATQLIVNRFEEGQQRIIEAIRPASEGAETHGLAAALLVGPLRHVDAVDDVKAAEELAGAGDAAAAAQRLLRVVERLDGQRLSVASETITQRAAALLAASGDRAAAVALLIGLVEAHIDRGSRWGAQSIMRVLEPIVDEEDAWVVAALNARIAWPEHGEAALAPLKLASDLSAGRPGHARWVAALTSLLLLFGRFERVLEASSGICAEPRSKGARLQVELDRLDALEATTGNAEADKGWLDLLRWVDREGDPDERGTAWQRRGFALARREDVASAEDAYRRAIDAWAASPGLEEQAGDAFFSLQSAYLVNGRMNVPDLELRPLAASLRGRSDTPVARAERLVSEGMSRRLSDGLPDAMYSYWMAHALQRRSGSLSGFLESVAVLAELYEHAGDHRQAMMLYVCAGNGDRAAKVLAGVYPPGALAQCLVLDVPRWERAAAYHVLGEYGRTLPMAYVSANYPRILDEARIDPDGVIAPQPSQGARKALAAIALVLPSDDAKAAFRQLRAQLHQNPFDVIRASTEALILATNAGATDATLDLLDVYLEDSYNLGIAPAWMAERAAKRDDVRERLHAEALKDHVGALEALAIADLIDGDGPLTQACARIVENATSPGTITESREGGRTTVSVGLGINLGTPATLARSASSAARSAFVDTLLAMLANPEEPELNRASAVGALFNLAPVLDADQAQRAHEALQPLALGKYVLSRWDEGAGGPLSRFRFSFHVPNVLRIAALATFSQLVAKHPHLGTGELHQAVLDGVADQSPDVVAAALDAASRVAQLQLPFPAEVWLEHPDAGVRQEAFSVWTERTQGLPTGALLERVRADPSINVRLQLLQLAATNAGGETELRWLADNDPDAYVRAVARRRLSEPIDS
jgi:tetratricopeptide (TPR) repeat protein